jgi:8-oxo-dGTP pyrophosphatase MutT (NUDIX family)
MKPASEYRIIYTGVFTEEDFRYEVLPGKRKYKPETRQLIKQSWQEARLNPGLNLFNGPVVSLISAGMTANPETGRNRLYLKVQATDYKSFYGTNVCNPNAIPKAELANPLAVCAVVETTDGTVFVGRRSEKLAETSGLWHVPGGTLSKPVSPLAVMRKELAEELNLADEDIQTALCLGFAENLLMKKPEFLCYFHLNISERQLNAKLEHAPDADEHEETAFVPLEELESFIDVHPFAPIGRACMKLYLDFIRQ